MVYTISFQSYYACVSSSWLIYGCLVTDTGICRVNTTVHRVNTAGCRAGSREGAGGARAPPPLTQKINLKTELISCVLT